MVADVCACYILQSRACCKYRVWPVTCHWSFWRARSEGGHRGLLRQFQVQSQIAFPSEGSRAVAGRVSAAARREHAHDKLRQPAIICSASRLPIG
eukprot:3818723-Pyramimonas_sp.AAC.1